jgi:hypothetical protein
MNDFNFVNLLYPVLVVVAILFIPYIFFLLAQQKILTAVQPHNRVMQPGEVWLQLIPIFGWIWQFTVVSRIADSICNEYKSQQEISFLGLGDGEMLEDIKNRATYTTGYWYCVLVCTTIIPILGILTGLGALVLWITYWQQLNKHRLKILNSNLR